jgi:hypothetical protein
MGSPGGPLSIPIETAEEAFWSFAYSGREERAAFLDTIAE